MTMYNLGININIWIIYFNQFIHIQIKLQPIESKKDKQ